MRSAGQRPIVDDDNEQRRRCVGLGSEEEARVKVGLEEAELAGDEGCEGVVPPAAGYRAPVHGPLVAKNTSQAGKGGAPSNLR